MLYIPTNQTNSTKSHLKVTDGLADHKFSNGLFHMSVDGDITQAT